jgi:redox-sensitive bicupin YhaK (pirin superfamily)
LLDLQLEPEQQMVIAFPEGHRALLYVYEGQALLGSGGQGKLARKGALSRLTDTGDLLVQNYDKTDCLQSIVLAGKPLGEPIVHFGPFVMNTPQEIEQAIMDYQCGRLTD